MPPLPKPPASLVDPESAEPAAEQAAAATPDAYYWLNRDEVVARLARGWRSEVFQPDDEGGGEWVKYAELDIAGEGQPITEEQATAFVELGEVPTVEPGGSLADALSQVPETTAESQA